jgi:parallel beta-helix repeat protein
MKQNKYDNLSMKDMKSRFWERKQIKIGIRVNLITFLLIATLIFSTIIQPGAQILSGLTTTVSAGSPRPDEVDLFGTNIWRNDSNVPSHNNLGFKVTSNAVLIIYPGVTVEFDSGRQLVVDGTLQIIGSPTNPVNLTSRNSNPSKSDWQGVHFTARSKGFVNHTVINYCVMGVHLDQATQIDVKNCTIYDSEFGVKSELGAYNNLLENNEIYLCDIGIGLYNTYQNTVRNNNLRNCTVAGVSLSVGSYENDIFNNDIYNTTENGFSISGQANNNNIYSNKIHHNLKHGIRCADAPNNTFRLNEIYSNKQTGLVLYYGADNNSFTGNTITQNGLDGLIMESVNYCDFTENDITWNRNGVKVENGKGMTFENNTVLFSTSNDFTLTLGSVVTSINNSYNHSKVLIGDLSLFYAYWYMFVETRDEGNSLVSAVINVKNNSKSLILNDTSINGKVGWIKCLGYVQSVVGQDTSMNPYWIQGFNGTKYLTLGFDMSKGSKTCVIKFVYYPPPESTLPTSFSTTEDSKLTFNVTDYFTSSEELEYEVEIVSGDKISFFFNPFNKLFTATPPPNWNGEERIRVSATANLGGEVVKESTIKVTPVNDAPVINNSIPNQKKREGSSPWELDLAGYAMDLDLVYGDTLTWYVSDVNKTMLNVTVVGDNNNVLRFALQNENVSGPCTLMVWVEDSAGESDNQLMWINITPENDPPLLSGGQVYPTTGLPSTYFNFTVTYFDMDNDPPNYLVMKLDNKITYNMLEVDSSDTNVLNGKDYYFQTILNSGSHFFRFESSDGKGGYFNTSRIDGPLISMPDKGSLRGRVVDSETKQPIALANITLTSLDNTSLKITTSTDAIGNYTIINLEPITYQVYAIAKGYKDSKVYERRILKGIVSILDFELEQLPPDIVNTPITSAWITTNITNYTQYQAIDFIGHAEDLDGDVLTFSWDFSDGTSEVLGKQVSHTFYDNGTFNVTLSVHDTDGNFALAFKLINVTPTQSSHPGNGNGNGGPKPSSTEDSDDLSASVIIVLVLLLIIVIIVVIIMFMRVQRRVEEEELRRQEEARRGRRQRKKGKYTFVDREKRNTEQVNILIADMHDRRGRAGPKGKKKRAPVEISKTDDVFELDDEFEGDDEDKPKSSSAHGKSKKNAR